MTSLNVIGDPGRVPLAIGRLHAAVVRSDRHATTWRGETEGSQAGA